LGFRVRIKVRVKVTVRVKVGGRLRVRCWKKGSIWAGKRGVPRH
jgi:hypothetical protein